MASNKSLEDLVVELAGGVDNVSRKSWRGHLLVLTLKDQSLADTAAIEGLEGVTHVELAAGRLRVAVPDSNEEDGMSSNKSHDLAEKILRAVGGKENVTSVSHCITRLRFVLKNESVPKDDEVSQIPGVIQVMRSGEQYQVVIGTTVGDVYDALVQDFGIAAGGEVPEEDLGTDAKKSHNLFDKLMDTISGAMGPMLMALAAAGMLKGFMTLFSGLGWISATDGVYQILYGMGDAFFYFLPLILGYTAAKKFGCSEFTGLSLGAVMCYPSLVALTTTADPLGSVFAGTAFQMNYYSTFLGIPIVFPPTGYPQTIIPILLAVWVASKVERGIKNHMPDIIRSMATPFLTFLIMAPLTYLVIGPVASLITSFLSLIISALYSIPVVGGAVAGCIIAGAWSVLVMFGLHWGGISIAMAEIPLKGYTYILTAGGVGPFVGMAQGLAICCRAREKKVRDIAIPSTVSQICGVGEPLMYGVLIPKKELFYQNIIYSAIGGLICGIMNVKCYMFGGMGLFSFPSFIDPATGDLSNMITYAICIGITCVITFVFTFLLYGDKEVKPILGAKKSA